MRKEVKIEVPQGYVIDKEKSTFEKIVFKKIDNRPKTWEEYCKLNIRKDCFTSTFGKSSVCCYHNGSYNEFQTEERIEQFIAIGKLMQLRDYWVRGYKEFKYALLVTRNENILVYDWSGYHTYPHILTFPTKKMAEEFKECFSDLIKKAFLSE